MTDIPADPFTIRARLARRTRLIIAATLAAGVLATGVAVVAAHATERADAVPTTTADVTLTDPTPGVTFNVTWSATAVQWTVIDRSAGGSPFGSTAYVAPRFDGSAAVGRVPRRWWGGIDVGGHASR